MPNNGYRAHLYPRFDSGCSFRFYKNSKLFLEIFYTFTHEQIHLYIKSFGTNCFFFFKRSTILLILAQLSLAKKQLRVRSDMFIARLRLYENEFTIFLQHHVFTSTKTEYLFVACYFHFLIANTKIKRGLTLDY